MTATLAAVVGGLLYDTAALIAAGRDDRTLWAIHRLALRRRLPVTVPAVALAQAWRGGPQPSLSRLLAGCRVEPVTEEDARRAGLACGKARTSDVVDALVVVTAIRRDDVVLTGDARDLSRLATALGARLRILEL
jgi:predicted nucleic acid-binding protein